MCLVGELLTELRSINGTCLRTRGDLEGVKEAEELFSTWPHSSLEEFRASNAGTALGESVSLEATVLGTS